MGALDLVASILGLIKCLWDFGLPHITSPSELENNLQSLRTATDELRDINEDVKRRIEIAEQNQVVRTRKQVKGWLQRTEILEREASQILENGEREIQRKCFWGRCPRSFRSSYKVGGKIERALVKVKEESSKGSFPVVADELPYDLAEERPLDDIVGLESIFESAWRSINDEKVGIIGLYGLGGVGKTTLLTKINNEFFIDQSHEFKLVIWVVVSKKSTVDEVQDIIHGRVNLKDANWHRKTQDEKAASIYKFLKGKKFVLLLDDMRERLDLTRIGIPLSNAGKFGKIVFTTRFLEVCSQMEARVRIKVICLAQYEAKLLFNAKVGAETLNSHPEIQDLAAVVCKECDGLPLALITIGRSMSGKKDPREWTRAIQILKDSPSKFTGMKDHVFNVLRFSYDSLNDETYKSCFLYCSIFPEDYNIPKETLIEHWVGDGLINHPYDISEARNRGNDVIEILKNACLMETSKTGDCVILHDVIRDMALWIANEDSNDGDKFVIEKIKTIDPIRIAKWSKAEKITIFHAHHLIISKSPICSKNLGTLVVRDCGLKGFPSGFFQNMISLRVLDMSNNRDLVDLPGEITALVNLQYLDLSKTGIENLPEEFRNLSEIRHLLLNNMMELTVIPQDVICRFINLRVLSMNYSCSDVFLDETVDDNVLSNGKEFLLQELEMSENLQDLSLILTTLESVTKLLTSGKLRRCTRNLYLKRCENITEVIVPYQCMEQMVNLERLEIRNCRSLKFMTVQKSINDYYTGFQNLHSVTITDCSMIEMNWLVHVPNLESLHLQGCKLLKNVLCDDEIVLDYEIDGKIFCKLRSVILFDLPEVTTLCPRSLPFPALEQMIVTLCPSLIRLPFDCTSGRNRLKKIVGWPSWWDNLEWDRDGIEPIFRAHFRSSN